MSMFKNEVDLKRLLDKVTDKEPFFSSVAYGLAPIHDESTPTTATNGISLFVNDKFLKSLSEEEQCGVILHEILHCVFLHLWRREDRDPAGWNVACDYAINLIVNESFRLPKGTLLDTKYLGMSAEEIYDKLPKFKSQAQSWCEKDLWDNNTKDPKTGKPLKGKRGEPVSEAQAKAKWKREFEKMKKSYSKGDMPLGIKRLIEKAYYVPVVDWASLVSQILTEDVNDYTFSQPDRRFLDADFILPDNLSIDRIKDVVFAYDTSGSIGDEDLHAFHGESQALMATFPNLQGWGMACDAEVQSFQEISRDQTFDDVNYWGGGGTAFEPVFEEVEKRRLQPKALFYFTDLMGSFPNSAPPYPVYWLVRSAIGDESNYDVPFGKVIKFLS